MIRSSFLKRLLAAPAALLAVRQPEQETIGEIYPWPAAKNITDSNAWYVIGPAAAEPNPRNLYWVQLGKP